jgi:hypothetical protein
MLRFIMYLIGGASLVFTLSVMLRHGLRLAFVWDDKICNRLNSRFCGFRRHYRVPSSIGVIPEFFYFLVLGRSNYFSTRWWALRAASYLGFLFFLAAVFSRGVVSRYYSLAYWSENGLQTMLSSGTGFWYLSIVNMLFALVIVMIIIESIRMHKAWAPVRILMYTVYSVFMAAVSMITLALIISVTFLYIAYRIIKFFFTSGRKVHLDTDDNDSPSEKLNNSYRRFRAELIAWEKERKADKAEDRHEVKPPVITRKRPKIVRKTKPAPVDDDIPRFYPD